VKHIPLDGIPSSVLTVEGTSSAYRLLMVFSAIVFFAPERAVTSSKPQLHPGRLAEDAQQIAPLWFFTPF